MGDDCHVRFIFTVIFRARFFIESIPCRHGTLEALQFQLCFFSIRYLCWWSLVSCIVKNASATEHNNVHETSKCHTRAGVYQFTCRDIQSRRVLYVFIVFSENACSCCCCWNASDVKLSISTGLFYDFRFLFHRFIHRNFRFSQNITFSTNSLAHWRRRQCAHLFLWFTIINEMHDLN